LRYPSHPQEKRDSTDHDEIALEARDEGITCRKAGVMADPLSMKFPLDGTLDLHTFQPGEVSDLVPEYLAACRERGILQVRIIHGKGSGTLRTIVGKTLAKLPYVESFSTAEGNAGGWGATIVTLRRI
jgi:dsDNA-specific endonuclease/ATPase MutS2